VDPTYKHFSNATSTKPIINFFFFIFFFKIKKKKKTQYFSQKFTKLILIYDLVQSRVLFNYALIQIFNCMYTFCHMAIIR
jgi:hypothetical protein